MSEELKPCPFCGDDPEIELIQSIFGDSDWMIICPKCLIKMWDEDKATVIAAWNTRVEPDIFPQWAIEAIDKEISSLWEEYAKTGITRLDACARKLEWVLSLLKPENSE